VNYEIVELEQFSGHRATIYSVILEGHDRTLFDHFVDENEAHYPKELRFIAARLSEMGHNTGAREIFFKHNEGKPGDGVCALYDDPKSRLRLYCIRYGNIALIVGGGGPKGPDIQAWQEDEKLSEEASTIIALSKDIVTRISNGELTWSPEGNRLEGNLNINDDEEQ
jgi:hypothetical protein